jgi:hypothetical protein
MSGSCTGVSPSAASSFSLWLNLQVYIVRLLCISLFAAIIQRFLFFANRKPPAPSLTKIRLGEVQDIERAKRAWAIIITNNGKQIHDEPHLALHDPFLAGQYSEFFKFLVDDSFKHPDDDPRLTLANERIRCYATELLRTLQLDNTENEEKQRNIVIVEEFQKNSDDTKSLHNAVWEVLEDVNHWEETKPEWVNVTRAICPPGETIGETGQDMEKVLEGISINKPIHMLLVIGRSLVKRGRQYEDEVEPHLVQRSIMQVMRHLEHVGHCRNIQLDILRPSTFDELKEYLDCSDSTSSGRKQFDIIHLDMHGVMLPNAKTP